MKTLLQNLLIFFALSLCVLISFQWIRETELRKSQQSLTDAIHDKMESIQNLQSSARREETEIQRLDGLKNQLTQTLKSNDVQIAILKKELEKGTNELVRAQGQIEAYKDALDVANQSINRQNEDIKRQNAEMAKLAEDRNQVVQKFNKIAADYNELANRWNKQQEDLAKAATNTPAQK